MTESFPDQLDRRREMRRAHLMEKAEKLEAKARSIRGLAEHRAYEDARRVANEARLILDDVKFHAAEAVNMQGTAAGYCAEPGCMGEAGHDGPHTSVDFRA